MTPTPFNTALEVLKTPDAAPYATELFRESFNQAFSSPVQTQILETVIRIEDWHQYVALYTWPDGHRECVGFCNFIRYKDVYLEGGLMVKRHFYRHLSREHFQACSQQGGVAQILMETAAAELNDAAAWFGYVGDAMSMQVTARVGYARTNHQFLIAKWFRDLSCTEKQFWVDEVARIGAF